MVNTAVRLWTSQPTKRSISSTSFFPRLCRRNAECCDAGLLSRIAVGKNRVIPFLDWGESTTTYASSKLNRVGRWAARYDSGLLAHKYNRPARKRPAPHRIDPVRIASSRSRCGNFTPHATFLLLFFPLPPHCEFLPSPWPSP